MEASGSCDPVPDIQSSDNAETPAKKENPSRKTPNKRRRTSETVNDADTDDNFACPICLDEWTSLGAHRLCSLKCGHLFGLSCLERWLKTSKTCPSCNGKAKKLDIRPLYARRLVAVDTNDVEEVRAKLQCCEQKLGLVQKENETLKSKVKCLQETIDRERKIAENERAKYSISAQAPAPKTLLIQPRLVNTFRLDEGTCRVIAYSCNRDMLALSQEKTGPLWPGFGIRLFPADEQPNSALLPLHKKEIRDLNFHPTNQDLMLTVSLDREVKVYDINENKEFFHWKAGEPIWCACWGFESNSSVFVYIGTGRGRVFRINTTTEEVLQLPSGETPIPVCSLKPSRKLNCLLCCRLRSLMAYALVNDDDYRQDVLAEDIYSGMAFSEDDTHEPTMVACCRPSRAQPKERYVVYRLSVEEVEASPKIAFTQLYVLYGGEVASPLSRPFLYATDVGLIFCAFVETASSVSVWLLGQDQKLCSIRTDSFVKDILAVKQTLYLLCPNALKKYVLSCKNSR